nr:HAD-IC family P-type ATPase [Bifidobacterium stellenboschense]
MLPVVIFSAIPVALLWNIRLWSVISWPASSASSASPASLASLASLTSSALAALTHPSLGQWIVIALVAYTVIGTVIGMIDDIRHGQVGIDLLAVLAMLSTLAVGEYWASWAVVLMVTSGEAIEEYAQSKAEHSLTALLDAAPRTAHVANLPGVGRGVDGGGRDGDGRENARRAGTSDTADDAPRAARNIAPIRDDDGFRHVTAAHAAGRNASGRGTATRDASGRGVEAENHTADDVCALTGRDPETCDPAVARADARVRPGADARFDTVPVDQVRLGDVVIVLPGETVPVDGELLSGAATLDLSAINGEPVPREVYAGARVMSGAVNGSTTLAMRAVEVAADSQYQRILAMVSQAQESRPAVVRTADRLAVPFTLLSLLIAGVAWAVAGTPLRFAQVLVLATPCPLLIAAPVAYIAGTSRLAAAGVLIKTQDVIEQLGRVTQVFFDKTGTLTVKQPQVVRVEMVDDDGVADSAGVGGSNVGSGDSDVDGGGLGAGAIGSVADSGTGAGGSRAPKLDEDHVLMFAGVVESYSVHVLAKGIAAAGRKALGRLHARYAAGRRECPENEAGAVAGGVAASDSVAGAGHGRYGRDYPVVTNVKEESGKGISAEVNGHAVRVGRLAFAAAGEDGFVMTTTPSRPAADSPRQRGWDEIGRARPMGPFQGDGPRQRGRDEIRRAHPMGSFQGDGSRQRGRGEMAVPAGGDRRAVRAEGWSASGPLTPLRGQLPLEGDAKDAVTAVPVSGMQSAQRGAKSGARFGMLAADEMASYVAVDGRLVARIVLRDVPRANVKSALARLHELGVAKLTMLTGDKRASAEIIAREVGIDEVHAELFPEDKVAAVRDAAGGNEERGNGFAKTGGEAAAGQAYAVREGVADGFGRRNVAGLCSRFRAAAAPVTMMVGDGVNDAPVLAAAGIGVAMTDGTSTAASESAQVVVMNDDIAAVPRAIAIARRTKRVMLQAVVVGLALAVIGMVAAAFDLIPVVVGAFLQEGIDVVSILWALTAVLDRD